MSKEIKIADAFKDGKAFMHLKMEKLSLDS